MFINGNQEIKNKKLYKQLKGPQSKEVNLHFSNFPGRRKNIRILILRKFSILVKDM